MYNLVKRLPIMVCPSWTETLSCPISIKDMVYALTFCVGKEKVYGCHYDLGGSTTLSYLEMMRILGRKIGRKRLLIVVPFFSPKLSRLWVTKITGAPKNLVSPLIGSLKTHMVPNIHQKLPLENTQLATYSESIDQILENPSNLASIPSAFRYSGANSEKEVKSIQRLETLYRFNATQVADYYFLWLDRFFPFLSVRENEGRVGIYCKGFKSPLLVVELYRASSSSDYRLFYIQDSLLAKGHGRLIFRSIIDGRNTMVEIHDFVPKLPWFIYKYSQALVHKLTMKLFNGYLLRLQKNVHTDFNYSSSREDSGHEFKQD